MPTVRLHSSSAQSFCSPTPTQLNKSHKTRQPLHIVPPYRSRSQVSLMFTKSQNPWTRELQMTFHLGPATALLGQGLAEARHSPPTTGASDTPSPFQGVRWPEMPGVVRRLEASGGHRGQVDTSREASLFQALPGASTYLP